MAKKPRTLRIDDDLWSEIGKAGEKLRPKEKHTEYIETAAWQRIKRQKMGATDSDNIPTRQKKGEK